MAMTEAEIQRRHAFYQTSYIRPEERIVRSASPELQRNPSLLSRRKQKQKKRVLVNVKARSKKSGTNTTPRQTFDTVTQTLDHRRTSRSTRTRPWREKTPTLLNKNDKVQLFYEEALPKSIDTSQIKVKARKYVTNTKYGKIYEIRKANDTPQSPRSPSAKFTYVWEDDYALWTKGSRDRYLEDLSSRSKASGASYESFGHSSSSSTSRPGSKTARPNSLPSIKEKADRPSAEVYAYYNSYRLEKSKRRTAAILIQKMSRGWNVRNNIKKLKRKALFDHGKTWLKFVQDYKEVVARIQARYGIKKTSCTVDLKQVNTFMSNKSRYQSVFKKLAADGKLFKEDLLEFFNLCDLWPTQQEINRSFDAIFRGSGNTAEVVFLMDCSTCIDVVGFYNVIKFVRDIVLGLDIAPDRIRVGVLAYNEDVFSSFGINAYANKRDVLAAISKIKIQLGLTRTDLALQLMLQMFEDSRPGVQKIGIVITDGKSTDPAKTEQEARKVHEAGVEMFVIGIGTNAEEKEMQAIATSPDHIFTAADPRSLSNIKAKVDQRFCLAACSFCQILLPRIARFGLLLQEALEIVWTTYPPTAANIGVEKYLSLKTLDSPAFLPLHPLNEKNSCRPITEQEGLDIIWTCYPPEACRLSHLRFSKWIRPIVDGKEAWALLDDKIIKATKIKACLKLVIKSKLERNGYILVPADVKEGVEKVTNEDEALGIVQDFINKQSEQENQQRMEKFDKM